MTPDEIQAEIARLTAALPDPLEWKTAKPKVSRLADGRSVLTFPGGHRHVVGDLDPAVKWQIAVENTGEGPVTYVRHAR